MSSAAPTSRSMSDAGPISSDSKKRSRLGYHRTSMACSHCRRRKIRCIPSSDQPDAKCQNCIRLKKDCQFHPVDQQDVPSRKSRSGSKADATLGDKNLMQISASPESSLDAPLSHLESDGSIPGIHTPWEQSGLVNSPATQMSGYNFTPQTWATPLPINTQSPYQRHNSHPGQYYLPTEAASAMPYNQGQFTSMEPRPLVPVSQGVFNDPVAAGTQYYDRNQSLAPAGNNDAPLQSISPTLYATSFSSPERRSTIPAVYNGQQNQSGMQFQQESGQYALPSQFNAQNTQHASYSQSQQPQTYVNHRGVLLNHNQRPYVQYPP